MNVFILEFLQSIRNNYNNLQIIEYDLDQLFSKFINMPYALDRAIQFAKIYREPIVYVNLGIEIEKYDSFLEMISTLHHYEKQLIGEKILEYSYKYKLAQEFKIELIERCKILCWKYNMSPIYEIIKKIFKKYKEYFDKNILETYYEYYNYITQQPLSL
jgi:hypothetical protein